MSEAIKARYQGAPLGEYGHEHVHGVPARDIPESEWDALPPEAQERAANARMSDGKPLYDIRTDREMHPSKYAEPARVKDEPKAADDDKKATNSAKDK